MKKSLKLMYVLLMIILFYMSITFSVKAIADFFSPGDSDFVKNIIVAGVSILALIFLLEPFKKVWKEE